MPNQKIQNIKVSDLYLWTENPRDPIDTSLSDVDVIKRAIQNNQNKWDLQKLLNRNGGIL